MMKKKGILGIVIVLLLMSFSFGQREYASNDKNYSAGEYLKYDVGYGWFVGAEAFLKLENKTYKGNKVFYAKGYGKTIGVADALYKVHDTYETYFDPQTGLPIYAIEDQKEGPHYTYHIEMGFDHKKQKVFPSKKVKKDSIPHRTFDILSAVYELRNKVTDKIKEGDKVIIHTFFQGKNWDLVVRFDGFENVKLKEGKLECYKFTPLVQEGEVFKDKEGLNVWVSHDKAKVPVKIAIQLWVGSFGAELVDYKGLKYPLNFQND